MDTFSSSGQPRTTTTLPAEMFDELVAQLDTPDDAPTLTAALDQPRRFVAALEN